MLNQKLPKYEYYAIAGVLTHNSIEQIYALSNRFSLADCYYETALLYEPHITVARGLHEIDKPLLKQVLSQANITFNITGVDILEPLDKDYDIVALPIHSHELIALNKTILVNTPHTLEYDYRPHVTLAFLKKGKAKFYQNIHLDQETIKLSLSHYVLYDKEGKAQII